jgi:small subunit ribosomal protein S9
MVKTKKIIRKSAQSKTLRRARQTNGKTLAVYFPTSELQQIATSSLNLMGFLDKFRVLVKIKGGGLHAQAEAARHAIARALILFNPGFRQQLKKAGYLTRDPRMRERKKFGLKRARRARQWRKR